MSVVATDIPACDWTAAERRAWRLPAPISPSEWAAANRVLTRKQTHAPGPLLHSRAPYLAGISDLCEMPGIEQVWIEKAAQVGASEAVRSFIGWCAEREPDPMILVLPNQTKGREIIYERVIPLFEDTACLSVLHTGIRDDVTKGGVLLENGFRLWLAWAGSPAALASHPCRTAIFDEVDKFVEYAGREADPVSLGIQRTKTYGDQRRLVLISSPTTADSAIHSGREACPIQLRYYVPCPECGAYQTLRWDRVRFAEREAGEDRAMHAARVKAGRLAHYECESCETRLTEVSKPRMVRAGVWAVEGTQDELPRRAKNAASGAIIGGPGAGWPSGDKVGVQIGELYCLWVAWAETAAAFIDAQGDPAKLMDWRNGRMGEPWSDQVATTKTDSLVAKCVAEHPAGKLPSWTQRVIMTVDVQLDHFYVVIRAWGYALQSRRIWHGRLPAPQDRPEPWDDLYRMAFEARWPFADGRMQGLSCDAVGIDAKYRTEEVYRFGQRDLRVKPLHGYDKALAQLAVGRSKAYQPPYQRGRSRVDLRVFMYLMDTMRLKDWLANAIASGTVARVDRDSGELVEDDLWQLNDLNDAEYNRQMSAEHKVRERRGMARPIERWVVKTQGADNHFWDCEYMQRAVAYLLRVELLPPLPTAEEAVAAAASAVAAQHRPRFTTPDGRAFLVTERE